MPLFDRAHHVLAELQAAGLGQRPICFVAHSMGGLLVKQMLRNADSLAPEFRSFSAATRGVVFLATPHTGSDLASLARYLGLLLRSTIATKELEARASPLLELNTWYRENVRRLRVATQAYFENQKTKGVVVVDRASADPSLEGVTVIGLDANHSGVCKPASRNDLLYKRSQAFILNVLGVTTQAQAGGQWAASEPRPDRVIAAARESLRPHTLTPVPRLANVTGDSNYVRVQVLTPAGVLDRDKQLGVVKELTEIVAAAGGDPTLTQRTWVLITESPEGGWGINGHANTGADIAAAARAELAGQ